MKYKVFISATSTDLGKQRAYAAEQLNKAGLDVNRMEEWPADGNHPAALSASRAKDCHFCVALVGFQRGTLATDDPLGRSITQVEIDTAKRSGAKMLFFLLADTPHNRECWPEKFNHLDDPEVQRWRSEIQAGNVCEFFHAGDGVDSMPQVLPAITRQITHWEQGRRRKLLIGLLALVGVTLCALLLAGYSRPFQQALLSRLHRVHDPVVFQQSRDGDYKVARLIDGRSDLRDNTNFQNDMDATQESWSMFANTFWSFQEYELEFENMLKRGVHVRLILTDNSQKNRSNWSAFYDAVQSVDFENIDMATRNTYARIHSLVEKYPDQFEFRLNRLPIFFSMWIRDPKRESGLGHLGVIYYSPVTRWPHFRVSHRTGGKQLEAFQEQFDVLWKRAIPYAPPAREDGNTSSE